MGMVIHPKISTSIFSHDTPSVEQAALGPTIPDWIKI